jgi:hypothetical protein
MKKDEKKTYLGLETCCVSSPPSHCHADSYSVVHPFAASRSRRTVRRSVVAAIRRLVVVLCRSTCGSRGRLGVWLFKLLFAVVRRALVNDQ